MLSNLRTGVLAVGVLAALLLLWTGILFLAPWWVRDPLYAIGFVVTFRNIWHWAQPPTA